MEARPKQPHSRLEVLEVDADGLTDADATTAAFACAQISHGRITGLSPAVQGFFSDVADQLVKLVNWRQLYVEHLDRALDEVDGENG